jgi:hypothetical protein
MTTTVNAIYEEGRLVLPEPLPLPDHTPVRVTIESGNSEAFDRDRTAWLKLSEASLQKVWDNPADDVFNELLSQ